MPTLEEQQLEALSVAEKAIAGTRRASAQLMTRMEAEVSSCGRFFAEFGFQDTSGLVTYESPEENFSGKVLLLTHEETIDNGATVFTAITAAGPRQIKLNNQEQISMIREQIKKHKPQLQMGRQTSNQGLEEARKENLKSRGFSLNEGLLNSKGTDMQIGTSVFTENAGSLIINPSEHSVIEAMKQSMEKAKKADSNLIESSIVEREKVQQGTIKSLFEVLGDPSAAPLTPDSSGPTA